MTDDRWILVPNWDRFQTYGSSAPPWIKLYLELQSRDDWLELTDADRGLLVTIWIEFARAEGRLKAARILAGGRQKNRRRALERLNDAGWIEVSASKPSRARAREETEKRRNRDSPSPKSKPKGATGWRIVRGTHGMTHVPDPFGTDRPPKDAPPLLKEML